MAQTVTPPGSSRPPTASRGSSWAGGGVVFAGVLLFVDGVLGILNGIAALAKDDVYSRLGDYVFAFDLTAWGWIHLILGAILAVTGLGILTNAVWARVLGVALASLSIIANFIWLPYQPLWALIAIAIGVFVVWSLCTERPDPTL